MYRRLAAYNLHGHNKEYIELTIHTTKSQNITSNIAAEKSQETKTETVHSKQVQSIQPTDAIRALKASTIIIIFPSIVHLVTGCRICA